MRFKVMSKSMKVLVLAGVLTVAAATTTTGLAAAVISTVHYQEQFNVTCVSIECEGAFKRPGASKQLNVTRVSCLLIGDANSVVDRIEVHLQRADGLVLVRQHLPVGYSSPSGKHTVNDAVDFQVAAIQHIGIYAILAAGTLSGAACTATGTLDTLG